MHISQTGITPLAINKADTENVKHFKIADFDIFLNTDSLTSLAYNDRIGPILACGNFTQFYSKKTA